MDSGLHNFIVTDNGKLVRMDAEYAFGDKYSVSPFITKYVNMVMPESVVASCKEILKMIDSGYFDPCFSAPVIKDNFRHRVEYLIKKQMMDVPNKTDASIAAIIRKWVIKLTLNPERVPADVLKESFENDSVVKQSPALRESIETNINIIKSFDTIINTDSNATPPVSATNMFNKTNVEKNKDVSKAKGTVKVEPNDKSAGILQEDSHHKKDKISKMPGRDMPIDDWDNLLAYIGVSNKDKIHERLDFDYGSYRNDFATPEKIKIFYGDYNYSVMSWIEIAAALHEVAHAELEAYDETSEKAAWTRAEELFEKTYMYIMFEEKNRKASPAEAGFETEYNTLKSRLFGKELSLLKICLKDADMYAKVPYSETLKESYGNDDKTAKTISGFLMSCYTAGEFKDADNIEWWDMTIAARKDIREYILACEQPPYLSEIWKRFNLGGD